MARLAALLLGLLLASPVWATWTYVGSGTAVEDVNTGGTTPTLHASTAEDDLILTVCGWHDSGAGETLDTPTGYTELREEYTTNDDAGIVVFGKIAGASETDPDVDHNGFGSGDVSVCQSHTFRESAGLDIGTVVAHEAGEDNPGSTGTMEHVGLTVSTDNTLVLVCSSKAESWASVDTLTTDAYSWTEIMDYDTDSGGDIGVACDYLIQTTAQSVSSGTFTVNTASGSDGGGEVAFSFAVVSSTNSLRRRRN